MTTDPHALEASAPADGRGVLTLGRLLVPAAVLLVAAAPASAATTIGQTSAASVPCTLGNLLFQGSTAAGPGYAVPQGAEVITSWSTQAGPYLGSMKLQIVRPGGGDQYSVVAESPPQDLVPNHLNTFPLSPPLPVQPGDRLGLTQTGGTPACAFGPGTYGLVAAGDTLLSTDTGIDPPVGTTFTPYGDMPLARLNASATVDLAPAPPPRPPSPSRAAATRDAFAGATLVSTRLHSRGRFVTLRLRCPAGTVGRCAGHTRLSARRQAAAVNLGKARFSGAPGRQTRIRIRMPAAAARLLTAVRRLGATATTATHDDSGRSRSTVAAVTIGAPRRATAAVRAGGETDLASERP
jgi:hypothetical protein